MPDSAGLFAINKHGQTPRLTAGLSVLSRTSRSTSRYDQSFSGLPGKHRTCPRLLIGRSNAVAGSYILSSC